MTRFERLRRQLESRGVSSPAGLAATIGRRKYGATEYARLVEAGRRKAQMAKSRPTARRYKIRAVTVEGSPAIRIEPVPGIWWDEWETRLDGKHHRWWEADNSETGLVLHEIEPPGKYTVQGFLNRIPATLESNPVKIDAGRRVGHPMSNHRRDKRWF